MSLFFSSDQQEFARSVQRVLASVDREFSEDDVLAAADAWETVATELSLLSVPVAEDRGGFGGSWFDVAAAVEELGRRPVLGGVPAALAGISVLATAPSSATDDVREAILGDQQVVIPTWLYSDRLWELSPSDQAPESAPDTERQHVSPGTSLLTPRRFDDPADAGLTIGFPTTQSIRLLVPVATESGTEIWLTEPLAGDALARSTVPSVDTSTSFALLDEALECAIRVHGADTARDELTRSRAVALALGAIEAVGSCDHLLKSSVEYLKVREQFGQTLAGMQGLKFTAADLFREIEPVRSLALAAIEALDGYDLAEMIETATSAKIATDRLHPAVALAAVQLHGGIGFTWELGLHRHYKRAISNRVLGGDDRIHREVLADRIRSRITCLRSQRHTGDDPAADVRREVRDWIAANAAHAPTSHGAHEPMSYHRTDHEEAWVERVRQGRWLCLSWPEEYGGRALSALECIAVNEEFANAGIPRPSMGMGETLLAPAILSHGTEEQKKRLLPRIISGEDVYCQGFSEPEHGSDLAHLETRGVVDGSSIVVNGTKVWQSGAHRANKIFLLCRTDPDAAAHRGITYCIADMESNGVEVTPIRMMPGDFGFNQVRLENTVVPLDNVIGELHRGWHVAMTTLGAERAGEITSQYLGYLREFDLLVDELDGSGRLDVAADDLVDLWLDIAKMKHNGRRVVDQLQAGLSADDLLSVDKLNWSEFHVRFGLDAARLLGVRGTLRPDGPGYPLTTLQRVMLESPGRRIARGTNQIQRRIIAERRLGMPK